MIPTLELYRDHRVGNELGGQGIELSASLLLAESYTKQKQWPQSSATGWAWLLLQAGCIGLSAGTSDNVQFWKACICNSRYDHKSLKGKGGYPFRSMGRWMNLWQSRERATIKNCWRELQQ